MPHEVRSFLVGLAQMHAPRECCGFILDDWSIYPIVNTSVQSGEFEMDHNEIIQFYHHLEDRAMGVYHSHPGGQERPSPQDIRSAPDRLRYFIIAGEKVIEWELTDGDPRPTDLADPVSKPTGTRGQKGRGSPASSGT